MENNYYKVLKVQLYPKINLTTDKEYYLDYGQESIINLKVDKYEDIYILPDEKDYVQIKIDLV